MTTPRLTDDAEFKELLPWAKAMAQAQRHTHLEGKHFVQAARMFMVERGWGVDTPELAEALAAIDEATLPKVDAEVTGTMPLSEDLKRSLSSAATARAWLRQLLRKKPSQTEASPLNVDGTDAVLQALMPWLRGAMRHHKEEALTTRAMAHGVLAALATPALDAHPDFRHWCHGHSDELLFWLEHQNAYNKVLEPVFDEEISISPAQSMQAVLSSVVHPGEHAPTPVWRWLHAAVAEANQHARLLQVAYHEAGHAVAFHVLAPEMTFSTASIVPKGNSGGRVGYRTNDQFNKIYENSLEYFKEDVVISLAGRAAEQMRFGMHRADSGAVGDIQGATALVWEGITAFGVDEVFGPVGLKAAQSAVAQNNQGGSFLTDMAPTGWLQDLAQQRLHTWMTWGLSEARRLLNAHWDQVDRLALALFERKTMSNAEVRSVLGASGSDFKLLEIPGQPPANNAPQRNRII